MGVRRHIDLAPKLQIEAQSILEGPLVKNASALYGATIVTSAFGFFYWLIAARMVPARSVGIAFAVQSVAQLLSLFCVLGLSTLLISELSKDSANARSIILTAAAIAGGSGLAISAFVGAALEVTSPGLGRPVRAHWIAPLRDPDDSDDRPHSTG